MVNLQKSGDSAVKFVFTDSDHYLYGNGEIEVPVNSLLLVIDESDMVTFKKLSGDPFLSFRADNSNLGTKAAIEQFYKDNMVGSSGGGSESGITSGEVQTMIDESISGKADTSDVTAVANDVQTVSGQVATKVDTSDFNTYSAATDSRLAEDEEVTAAALNDLDENKQGKLAYYEENTEDGYADIYITNDDGQGNVDEYSFNIGGASADLGRYNQYDDGQGNSGYTSAYIQIANPEINIYVESEENGETEATYFNITPLGATINNENVATEPYVDAALSGKADTSAVTAIANDVTVLSGAVDDAKAYYISFATLATQGISDDDWDGIVAAIDAHRPIYAGYPRQDGGIIYYGVECMNKNSGNTEIVMTASDNSAHYFYTFTKNGSNDYSYTVSTKPYVPDITTAITSGSTDAQVPSAKATYDAITAATTGGGATYSAGTNISIDTANTINCTLNLANGTGNLSLKGGDGCTASGLESFASGYQTIADREGSVAFGKHNVSNSTGSNYFNGKNNNYLFTVGNGYSGGYRHNALEIRQNGDLYFADTDNTTYVNYYEKPMVRLQDMYAALGGLKFVQCTQAEYDALVSGGTVDSSTIYFISNVVS